MSKQNIPVLEALTLDEFLGKDYGIETVITEGILDRSGLLLIEGPTEAGKSYLAQQMAFDMSRGEPILGQWAVERPFNVLLVQAEIGAKRFQDRTSKLAKNYEGYGNQLFLATHYNLKLDTAEGRLEMDRTLRLHKIEVVLLDPMRPFHQGDENSSQEMEKFFGQVKALQEIHNIAVVFTHHERKTDDPRRSGLQSARGSSLITDRPDTILRLSKSKDRTKSTLSFEKLRNGDDSKHPDPLEMTVDLDSGLFLPTTVASSGLKTGQVLALVPAEPRDFGRVSREIAEEFGVGQKTAERKLTQMEAEGLVTRRVDPNDKRKKLIVQVKT